MKTQHITLLFLAVSFVGSIIGIEGSPIFTAAGIGAMIGAILYTLHTLKK